MSRPAPGVAVVSGGGSGIGAAVARALGERGHALALLGRRPEPLSRTLAASGRHGAAYPVDVRDAAAVDECARRVAAELGAADVVVAAAGVAHVGRFAALDEARFRETVEVNLVGAANLFRAFLPGLLERGSGTLVAILSVAARRVFPGWSAYAASKWGLLGLVESLREELAGSGVRLLALTPGATATPLWEGVEGSWERERMIPAAEVARALRWALDAGDEVAVEEIRLQPPGGNL
jgi:NADP-dependent 3-hydroxy acid dehydrogenase YdfG